MPSSIASCDRPKAALLGHFGRYLYQNRQFPCRRHYRLPQWTSASKTAMSNNLQNTIVLAAGLSLFIGLPLSATVQASSKGAERRVYEVQIDKKPAGTYTLDLQDTSDGVDLQSRCDVD